MRIIEGIIVIGMAVFLVSWVLKPLRANHVIMNRAAMEVLEREQYRRLSRVIEDIREASGNRMAWSNLDPSDLSYEPTNFPWFAMQSATFGGPTRYACYYFQAGPQTFWRVITEVPQTLGDPCNPAAPGARRLMIATGLQTPSRTEPMFQGQHRAFITFTLRKPIATHKPRRGGDLPQMIQVSRMGAVRN